MVKSNGLDKDGKFNIYRFRHTFCTIACEKTTLDVARRLTGHANVTTLDKKYNHVRAERKKQANIQILEQFSQIGK